MDPSEIPTKPIWAARTIMKTTDEIALPQHVLVRDAEATSVPGVGAGLAATHITAELDGHDFLDCLERAALGEIWKVVGPDRKPRIAHFFHEEAVAGRSRELDRLWAVSHPALPPLGLARGPSGRLVLLADGYDQTFAGWLRECRAWGLPGVPRTELLAQLRFVAQALDEIYHQSRLAHLGLHPGNLWLKDGRVRLGGFGLVNLLGPDTACRAAALHPVYAAPELFDGEAGPRSDQYSLALIYAEMVTGIHPLCAHAGSRPGKPNLVMLATAEREVIRQAVNADPRRRFASCRDLVAALEGLPGEAAQEGRRQPGTLPVLLRPEADGRRLGTRSLDEFARELVGLAAGGGALCEHGPIRYHLEPGRSLRHRCGVSLFAGAAALKLEGFRQEWDAEAVLRDQDTFVFAVRAAPLFWERLVGRHIGLEIEVRVTRPARPGHKLSELTVVIRPFGCGRERAVRLLESLGPVVLERLRAHLQVRSDLRAQDRLVWNQPLRVVPVLAGLEDGAAIECVGKDISVRGIGLFLPRPLPASHFYVRHPTLPALGNVQALARVVRGQRCPDGWYEVGAQFALEGPQR